MKRNILITILILSLMGVGCNRVAKIMPLKKEAPAAPAVKKVESLELAKLILKPKKVEIDVSKDPFKPLINKEKEPLNSMEVYNPEDLQFLGVVRVGEEYSALLKNEIQKGVFRIDDKIKDYTIVNIEETSVVLSNGNKTITLKRGEAK